MVSKVLTFVFVAASLPAFASGSNVLVCAGAKVYPSPAAPAIENATVVVRDGKIVAVATGSTGEKKSSSATRLDCRDRVVVAGFWNSHVHFTEPVWDHAASAPAAKLEAHMQEMLTQWGFTTVWDLGSMPQDTLALRKRTAAGEIPGPQILMAGDIFPKGGHPVYLPAEMQLPEAATPQEAEQMARQYLDMGLDGIKLFAGAFMGNKPVINMDLNIVKAAADVAHTQGKPVFAHPQNYAGVDNALNGGVDILAHTIPNEGHYTPAELEQMKRQHTALIPTLTLWTTVVPDVATQNKLVQAGVDELRSYFAEGGTVLFGTDVGFISKYDTAQEYEFMGRVMGWRDILASLTTNPSTYFHAPGKGRVAKGMDADFVVLEADPAVDVRNFARIAYTVRRGQVIFESAQSHAR